MYDKIRNAARNKHFYLKLIALSLLVSLLPLLAVSFFLDFKMRESMKDELHLANASYLDQTANAVELVIKQIGKNFEQFTLDSSVRDFAVFPRGNYYEQLSGSLNKEDLPTLERYLAIKKKLLWNLDALKSSNDFIHSVQYVDYAKDIALDSYGSSRTEDLPYPEAAEGISAGIAKYPFFLDARSLQRQAGDPETKQIIPVVYNSPNPNTLLIVNLDAELIYAKIVKKLEKQSDAVTFVLAENGNVLLSGGDSGSERLIAARIGSGLATGGTASAADGKKLLVTYKKSAALGWTFVNAVAPGDLYQGIARMRGLIATTVFVLVAATGAFVLLASRSLYNPISSLVAYVRHADRADSRQPQPDGRFGELKLIRTSLERAITDRESLQGRLKESLPAYKEKFLLSLLRGHTYDRNEIAERMAFLGIDLPMRDLTLMVVYGEPPHGTGADMESRNLDRLRLGDVLEMTVAETGRGIVVDIGESVFAVVVACGQAEAKRAYELAERIRDSVLCELRLPCTIGIGYPCADILDMKRAYEEAGEAIRYRRMNGEGEIISLDDVRLQSGVMAAYSKDKEAVFHRAIMIGQTDHALRLFAELTSDIRPLPFRHMQRSFMQLLVGLMETANGLSVDLEQIAGSKTSLYAVLLQEQDPDETIAWFGELIRKLSRYAEEALQAKSNAHVDEALRLIEQSSGQPISLASVADRLHLNPSYLSRIFKEKTGVNFLEYLTGYRIETSKRLLLETDMKLQDICDMLGYNKVNYFIRIFKETTGTTPGDYRKMHLEVARHYPL
ncbi:helix-turn-helix domain-containing protein [Paenibacillus cymbidii]|uniref:helix-turn-helix domain-containing protein n=1 Tax=Paenibacillus cymbidii TaxID=1639034 RepID=UPI001436AD93|nr:helix-turn-helix domain-containing protein [Paenibacillus cymbidii]